MRNIVIGVALVLVIAIRFWSFSEYPLADTTEARYGEVTRVMFETGELITPQLEPGLPFLAKPPLSYWQNVGLLHLFGLSESTLRLSSLMNFLGVIVLILLFGHREIGLAKAGLSGLIVMTSVVGFVTSGAVMTDAALLCSTTLAMVAFWKTIYGDNRGNRLIWGYSLFIGLSMGMLAKGPVAWILIGLPVFVWVLVENEWRNAFRKIPFVSGVILMIGLTAPWYAVVELDNRGFLEYFFIGEHFYRFIDDGWQGDRYGTAHSEARGTIWLFSLQAFAPWSLIAIVVLWIKARSMQYNVDVSQWKLSSLHRYLLVWLLCPLLFFTMARNILPTYVLTGLPAFAILLALILKSNREIYTAIAISLIIPTIVLLAHPLGIVDRLKERSQAGALAHVKNLYPKVPIFYLDKLPFSARFYSKGQANLVSKDEFVFVLEQGSAAIIFVPKIGSYKGLVPATSVTIPLSESKKYIGFYIVPSEPMLKISTTVHEFYSSNRGRQCIFC